MKREKGKSLVEFALVLPIFLFILITLIELCLVVHNYLLVSSCAQEAARIGAVGSSDTEIRAVIDEALGKLINTYFLKGEVPADGVTITPVESERRVGEEIMVSINYKVWVNIGYIWTHLLGLELPARAQLPIEST